MKKELFKEGLEVIVDYVVEELKKEIEYQFNSIVIGEYLWGIDDKHINYDVAVSHLKIVNDYLWMINDEGEVEQEGLDDMYLILYEEPYYKFNIIEIVENSDVEVDANEINRVLISYLKGKSLEELLE